MIKVEEITRLPRTYEKEISELALRDLKGFGLSAVALVTGSERAWKVSKDGELFLYAGVYRGSLFSSAPELWVMLSKDYPNKLVSAYKATKELRKQLAGFYPRLVARCDKRYAESLRFAEAFGFREVRKDAEYIWLEA